jgi:hypothetical protein
MKITLDDVQPATYQDSKARQFNKVTTSSDHVALCWSHSSQNSEKGALKRKVTFSRTLGVIYRVGR